MLEQLQKAAWLALFACLVIGFGFEIWRASNHQKDHQPPRKYWSQMAFHDKGATENRTHLSAAVQIDCDPNCTAKNPEENRNQNYITRIFYKTVDDPLAILTGILAVATVFLVLTVLCQVRDFRRLSKLEARAYVWPGFAHSEFLKSETRGVRWYITLLNTGRTVGVIQTVYHAIVPEKDYWAGNYTYEKFTERENVVPPMRPGGEIRTGVHYDVVGEPKICCGYIVYRDVFEDWHTQAWKNRLHPDKRKSDSLPGCYTDPPRQKSLEPHLG